MAKVGAGSPLLIVLTVVKGSISSMLPAVVASNVAVAQTNVVLPVLVVPKVSATLLLVVGAPVPLLAVVVVAPCDPAQLVNEAAVLERAYPV